MSRLITIGSGSSGNSYILECEEDKLIIELGVDFAEILKTLCYNINDVVGCIVSHAHSDHSKSITHAIGHALPIYSCQEVVTKYKQVNLLELGKKTQIGGFKIQPIEVEHSCQCYAFLIEHNAIGRAFFCTDCKNFPYKIKNLNHIFIEANYDEELVIDNICKGMDVHSMYNSHMELQSTIRAIRNNFSPSLQTICLIHLSGGNAEPKLFQQIVKEEFGFDNVFIAEKGLEIPLQLSEF